jgi:hypothetical protein
MGELYRLDFASGKSYIGISRYSAAKRFKQHRQASQKSDLLLYRAWRAYGEPTLTVLAVLEESILLDVEISAIAAYGTLSPGGYNSTTGGDISPALMDEVKKKIGDRHRGRVMSDEWIAKISAGGKGKRRSAETRARMSESLKLRVCKPETREKLAALASSPERRAAFNAAHALRRGIPLSPERAEMAREALRIARLDPLVIEKINAARFSPHSEETKAKMSAAAKGKPKSAEHRANLSKSRMGMRPSDEARAKMSAAQTGRKHSPETIQKIRDAAARRKAAAADGVSKNEISNLEPNGGLHVG